MVRTIRTGDSHLWHNSDSTIPCPPPLVLSPLHIRPQCSRGNFHILFLFSDPTPLRLGPFPSQTSSRIYPNIALRLVHSTRTYLPMKMEQTECSETLAYKFQTLGNHPKESIQQVKYYCTTVTAAFYKTWQKLNDKVPSTLTYSIWDI